MTKLDYLIEENVQADTPQARRMRAALGALYGLLGGSAFALIASFVDVLRYPDLPLGVDWSLLGMRWSVIGLGLALVGAVASWWGESWYGLGSGALAAGILALGSALYTSQSSTGLRLMVLLFALLPVAVLALPIVLLLRWLAERHVDSLSMKQSTMRIVRLVLIILVLGAVGGSFLKMSPRAATATRYVHNLFQLGNNQKILAIEGVSQRVDQPYHLFQSKSKTSTEGFTVRVAYKDGYVVNCEVVLYPGRDPRLASCQSGP